MSTLLGPLVALACTRSTPEPMDPDLAGDDPTVPGGDDDDDDDGTGDTSTPPTGPEPLRLHPDNPHYFRDGAEGAAVLIASYSNIVPSSSNVDYAAELADSAAHGATWCRVWHLLPWEGDAAFWPWARSGGPGAYLGGRGGERFDLDVWDETYWTRLRDAVGLADAAGIQAEVHLFDRVGISPAADDRWGSSPWASDNNANALETPTAAPPNDGTPEFYALSGRLAAYQEAYVARMVDELAALPNAVIEVENEHWDDAEIAWAEHWASAVKDRLSTVHGAERLVSYNSLEADLEDAYDSAVIDIVNLHFGEEAESDPSILHDALAGHWDRGKAMVVDEFANGLTDPALLRRMGWIIVTSGGHFHIEDADLSSDPWGVVAAVGTFLRESGWDFVASRPDPGRASVGTCMATDAAEPVEVVCYVEDGGGVDVDLPAGAWEARWFDAATGQLLATTDVASSGGITGVPAAGTEAVLQLRR